MAELMLKIGEGSNYEDGDVLHAFNRRRIGLVHAEHIGNITKAGGGKLVHRTYDSIARRLQNATYQYEFKRVSTNFVKRTNLWTGESKIIGKKVDEDGNAMDVPLFVKRRLNHKRHRIFGSPGKEIWFGGKSKLDATTVDSLWDQIEEHTPNLRKDHELWPVGNLDCKNHLQIKIDDFDEKTASLLQSSISDEKGRILHKRAHNVIWKELPQLDGNLKKQIPDNVLSVDIRTLWMWFKEEITLLKGIGYMVDLDKLTLEYVNDPLERGYANMTPSEVAENMNEFEDRNITKLISSAELLAWAGVDSRFMRISRAADNEELPDALRSIAHVAKLLIMRDGVALDLSLSDRAAMIQALVDGGVLTTDDVASVQTLASATVSRAEELGFSKIFPSHISYIKEKLEETD